MTLPAAMRFIRSAEPGGPETLVAATGELPAIGPAEVLIRVQVAGVNRVDVQQRRGQYPLSPGDCPVLGVELAGEVVSTGAEVRQWRPGDRVCALVNGGGYAEFCAAPAVQCLPWPAGYDALHAAALPQSCFTVWENVFSIGRLAAGETLLVHGGSSGIGVTAIQLARAFGSGAVYATAGSAEKCAACVGLGAEAAINYRDEDFVARIRDLTGGRGVDVVLDMVGAPYAARNLRCLARGGRLVMIAFMEGSKAPEFDFARIMLRHLTVTGSTLRPRSVAEKAGIAGKLLQEVWPVLSAGRCRPLIDTVLPLERAAEAHARMESSRHIGKIMLQVQ